MQHGMKDSGPFEERVISSLSALEEGFRMLSRAQEQDRVAADESRSELHRQVESANIKVAEVQGDVKVSALVSAQTRDRVDAMARSIDSNAAIAAPSIDFYNRQQSMVKWILWVVSGGGVAVAIALATFGHIVGDYIRHWLGLPPN